MATPSYRAPAGFLDFTAISQGRRNRQLEQQADEVYEFGRDQRQREMEQRQWDRQASDYLAPILGNRQLAADAGIPVTDFYLQQREQMLADPGYQALDTQAQSRALNQLQQSALVTAQQAQQRGDLASANRLMEAFGVYPANTQVDLAAQTGDAGQIVQAIQQEYGSDLGFDPATNTVLIAGQRRPVLEALPNIYRARSTLGAYPAAGQALQTDTQLQQALQLANTQRQREDRTMRLNLLASLAGAGDASALQQLREEVLGAAAQTVAPAGSTPAATAAPVTGAALPTLQGGTPAWLEQLAAASQPGALTSAATVAGPTAAAEWSAADGLPLPGSLTPAMLAEAGVNPQVAQLMLAQDKTLGRRYADQLVPGLAALPSAPSWLLPLIDAIVTRGSAPTASPAASVATQPAPVTAAPVVAAGSRVEQLRQQLAALQQSRTAGLPYSDAQWRLQAELNRLMAEGGAR